MKQVDYLDHSVRCKSCEHSADAHTKENKCLYGPGTYEPWGCDAPRCSRSGGHFIMGNHIFRTDDGRCFHGGCVRALNMLGEADEIYGNVR